MASLKIRAYSGGNTEPDKTVTIPLRVLDIAARLIPREAAEELKKEGIDLDAIAEISQKSDVQGTILEAENHVEDKRVVISIE